MRKPKIISYKRKIKEIENTIFSLMMNHPDGFPPEVFKEVNKLQNLADKLLRWHCYGVNNETLVQRQDTKRRY